MRHDSRKARLRIEQEGLIRLAKRSEFIDVQEIGVQAGWPPENYVITFTCLGIARVDAKNMPESSAFHQVSLYLSRDFPRQAPHMRWMTPIWHPNIQHVEPHHVCVNDVQNWHSAKSLYDLVVSLGEMVQYKWYHALWKDPWPLDREAAKWVVEFAEPRGIVGPHTPFDDRPLLSKYEMRLWGGNNGAPATPPPPPREPEKIRFGVVKKPTDELRTPSTGAAALYGQGLNFGVKLIKCPVCGQKNRLKSGADQPGTALCGNCNTMLNSLPTGNAANRND